MDSPNNMNTFAGRLATFQSAHQLPKRRASAQKKKGAGTVSWPHKALSAEELSRAGFFYQPSADSTDNCVCFVCHRNLDGWEDGDNPVLEHLTHGADCGWAINAYIMYALANGQEIDEDPLSARLVDARTATFAESWPHEGKRGWKCKISKMVEAGWIHDPTPEYDDCVVCPYCNLSLDGWEPKDNPIDEHKRRAGNCPFFDLCDQFAATRKQTKGKKSRASRASKASRVSTQSDLSVQIDAPSITNVDLDMTAADDDTVVTTATTASKAGKGRKKATGTKATRGRPKKAAAADGEELGSSVVPDSSLLDVAPPMRATRKASRTVSAQVDNTGMETEISIKPTRGKGKGKAKQSEDASRTEAGDSSLQLAGKRGVKRTSDGVAKEAIEYKANSSVVVYEEEPTSSTRAPRSARATRQKKVVDEPSNVSEMPPPAAKPASKAKAGKKTARQPLGELEMDQPEESENIPRSSISQPRGQPSQASTPKRSTPDVSPDNESPGPSTPTPARPKLSIAKQRVRSTLTPAAALSRKGTSPEGSPQSSDAENQPPSSRPMLRNLDLYTSPFRAPLASTPKSSPSRRNLVAGLQTREHWSPTDLEAVFYGNSPQKFRAMSDEDKENAVDVDPNLDMEKLDKKSLPDVVQAVRKAMRPGERNMTVEEWVRWHAKRGEERLRTNCEALVTLFESEGERAMRSLEAIVSVDR